MSTLGINLQKSCGTEISKSTDIEATTRTINTFAKRRTRFSKTEPTKGEIAEPATLSRTSQSIGRDKDKGKNTYIAPAVESEEEEEEEEKTRHLKKIKPTKTNPQEESLSHTRTSLPKTSYSDPDPDPDPPSSSTDDSEEEIRKTVEKIRREEDARFSRHYRPAPLFDASKFASTTVPTLASAPAASLPNRNPKTKPKPLQKAPPPQPLFKPWTWHWKPPHPITRIPIPPAMHPESSLVDPAISLRYACGHVLPTYIIPPDTSYPASPVTPTRPTTRTTRTTPTPAPPHTLPPFESESIRSVARREKLSTIIAGQECMCPNCFFWWHWVVGIVGLCVLFGMGIWMCWGVREWGRVLGEREGRWRLVVDFAKGEGE